MNFQKITKFDTANGIGIRTVLWVSGCNHYCKGCQNPDTWNPSSGKEFTSDTLDEIIESLEPSYIKGLTFSGGDPLYPANIDTVTEIAKEVKSKYPEKDIWLWTGFLYEEVKDLEIMNYLDVLVDGPFILGQRDLTLPYSGSTNQRVIDIKKSINEDKLIIYN